LSSLSQGYSFLAIQTNFLSPNTSKSKSNRVFKAHQKILELSNFYYAFIAIILPEEIKHFSFSHEKQKGSGSKQSHKKLLPFINSIAISEPDVLASK
jgi:hypothetical protein